MPKDLVPKHESYRPVSATSHWIDVHLFGPRAWPMHLHNILLGLLSIVLVSAVGRALGLGVWLPCLWALHPLHVEVFAYISARSDLLAAIFSLLALLSVLRSTQTNQVRARWLGLAMGGPVIPEKLAPDLLERLIQRFGNFPLFQGWELSIERLEPGLATLRVGHSEKVRNTKGDVHGGVQAAVADSACAMALCTVFDGAMPFATSDLHIRYLEPARGEVLGEGKVIRFSGRGAILECRLTCGGHLVALCTANFAIKHGIGG